VQYQYNTLHWEVWLMKVKLWCASRTSIFFVCAEHGQSSLPKQMIKHTWTRAGGRDSYFILLAKLQKPSEGCRGLIYRLKWRSTAGIRPIVPALAYNCCFQRWVKCITLVQLVNLWKNRPIKTILLCTSFSHHVCTWMDIRFGTGLEMACRLWFWLVKFIRSQWIISTQNENHTIWTQAFWALIRPLSKFYDLWQVTYGLMQLIDTRSPRFYFGSTLVDSCERHFS
jgi:hypothetical protein